MDVIRDIHPDDAMYAYAPDLYFPIGHEALRCIELALVCARLESPSHILDFASGAGRVMRYLKAAFPDATLTACDFHMWQADFCGEVFGATAVEGKENPAEVELSGPFDLIWCGSHFNHIEGHRWVGFLELFESVLSPGGVLVFTAVGRFVAGLLQEGKRFLNLTEEQVVELLRSYDATGFGFQPNQFDGDGIASRAWVCTQLENVSKLELLLYMEHAWHGQDVIACRRRDQ